MSWGSIDRPFPTCEALVSAVTSGGIAAMEVVARDLKALGLYCVRSLSYAGVTVDLLHHELTPEQIRVYDGYADAFEVIHRNLDAALQATNITGPGATYNRNAKAAAKSAFESNKQRFFNYRLTSMMTPAIIRAMEADIAEGRSPIGQNVSTSEALLERRLAEIPTSEWHDLSVDCSPREYLLDYLAHGFPVHLFEIHLDDASNLVSTLARDNDGNPIVSREALEKRDAMIERIAGLPPLATAFDQIIHHFRTERVAEVTGRKRRIVKRVGKDGIAHFAIEKRSADANLAEAQSFMANEKPILIFSEAGGTGRSYHADRSVKNQRQRVHYLIEAGWRVEPAVLGLGRSNRTNQVGAPILRPCTTDVKGQKRFISTVARRLYALGAITCGQRQTGGQGLFRAEDNLEVDYARLALWSFYRKLHAGRADSIGLERFEEATGLSLSDSDGSLKEELPPITTFLNRLRALRIEMQNAIFAEFEAIMDGIIVKAKESGAYDRGVEMLHAEKLAIKSSTVIKTHASGAVTNLVTLEAERKIIFNSLEAVIGISPKARPHRNARSGHVAIMLPHSNLFDEDGLATERVKLIRPNDVQIDDAASFAKSHWKPVSEQDARVLWQTEIDAAPKTSIETIHLVIGLLLPISKSLPEEGQCVYRTMTDDGQALIGRKVEPEIAARLLGEAGAAGENISPDAIAFLIERGVPIRIDKTRVLKRVLVMGQHRIECLGFTEGERSWLKSLGVFAEIMQFRLRLFVPMRADAPETIGRIRERFAAQGSLEATA